MSTRERRARIVVAVVMILLGAAALRDLTRLGAASPWRAMDEFADFYCAGSALNRGASPYTYEPLRTCEHAVNVGESFRGELFRKNPAVAVPAPQPAYDFVPFMAAARLPAAPARVAYGLAIVVAAALCAAGLVALGVPASVAFAALALSTAYVALNAGQIVPFALLALVLSGLALSRGRDAAAGVAAALTLVEPTVGVPVTIAAFLFMPRARWAVVLTLLALFLATWLTIGGHGIAQYVTAVLPEHAASEVRFPYQYSLTYALAALGTPAAVARAAGALSYLVLLAAGLFVAPRAQTALRRPELLVFIPALCALIGGPFLHQEELCFALPALLVVACATHGRARLVTAIALCLISIPWILVWGIKQLFLASIFVAAAILLRLHVGRWTVLATLVAIAALVYAFELHPPKLPAPATMPSYTANDLVQREWRDYTDRRGSSDLAWFAIKIPAWAALVAGLVIAAGLTPRSRDASESNHGSSRETRRPPTASQRVRTDSSGGLA